MTSSGNSELAKHVRLAAPKQHGEILQLPPISKAAAIVDSNRILLAGHPDDLQAIRLLARKEISALALSYSQRYLAVELPSGGEAIVMSGHQPTLFHPGVWFKNFVLNSVANRVGATPINLVVDNDLCQSVRVRAPMLPKSGFGTGQNVYLSMDQPAAAVPFEMRRIVDRESFEKFGEAFANSAHGVVASPLIKELWPEVVAVSDSLSLPASLAAGRHRLEVQKGVSNLELPISLMATSQSFAMFVEKIALEAGRFREIHNAALHDYRVTNRIRSRSHPVPELDANDGFIEVPFWFWTAENPQRRSLFAKATDQSIELSDRNGWSITIDRKGFASAIVELNQIGSDTFIRPRALTTTMFSRLFASDLFIHGIGGAKYDQLGDEVARRFFGVETAEMMAVSATMKLPFDLPETGGESVTQLQEVLRRMRYHPELELPDDAQAVRKRELVHQRPSTGSCKTWHDEIEALNLSLYAKLASKVRDVEERLSEARDGEGLTKFVNSREFSFALFPATLVKDLVRLTTEPTQQT